MSVSQSTFVRAVIARCALSEHNIVRLRLSVSVEFHFLARLEPQNSASVAKEDCTPTAFLIRDMTSPRRSASNFSQQSTGKKIEAISTHTVVPASVAVQHRSVRKSRHGHAQQRITQTCPGGVVLSLSRSSKSIIHQTDLCLICDFCLKVVSMFRKCRFQCLSSSMLHSCVSLLWK